MTPFPVPPQTPGLGQLRAETDANNDSATPSSLEESTPLSSASIIGTRHPVPAVAGGDTDERSSSLAPALSTTSTALARRLEKATRIHPLFPLRGSLALSWRSLNITGGGTRVKDEQPPPYAAR